MTSKLLPCKQCKKRPKRLFTGSYWWIYCQEHTPTLDLAHGDKHFYKAANRWNEAQRRKNDEPET